VRRIGNSQQLEKFSDLSVLAEVAELPVRRILAPGGASISLRHDLGVFEESIDSLRTCLMLHDDRRRLRVLAVASAVPGEGKTSVASQLAVSMARASGSRTLLIDGDMRSPDIHRIFEIRNQPGLAKLLDGQCTIEEAIVTDWSDSVHLLPAGDLHKSPHKLLGGGTFDALLEKLRGTYEYIIVDVPPILSASEALVLAKSADGTLVCALRGHSREVQVRLACERLLATGARPVGATLNGVPVSKYASTYGSYAYSYAKR
jgi:capsular exopolysaccharide synthesis family protein